MAEFLDHIHILEIKKQGEDNEKAFTTNACYCYTFVFLIPVDVCAISDTTPPELTSITINANSFYGGDTIEYVISGTDDLYGLKRVNIGYRLKNGSSTNRFTVELELRRV